LSDFSGSFTESFSTFSSTSHLLYTLVLTLLYRLGN
jgi:hypothetical protein